MNQHRAEEKKTNTARSRAEETYRRSSKRSCAWWRLQRAKGEGVGASGGQEEARQRHGHTGCRKVQQNANRGKTRSGVSHIGTAEKERRDTRKRKRQVTFLKQAVTKNISMGPGDQLL